LLEFSDHCTDILKSNITWKEQVKDDILLIFEYSCKSQDISFSTRDFLANINSSKALVILSLHIKY